MGIDNRLDLGEWSVAAGRNHEPLLVAQGGNGVELDALEARIQLGRVRWGSALGQSGPGRGATPLRTRVASPGFDGMTVTF